MTTNMVSDKLLAELGGAVAITKTGRASIKKPARLREKVDHLAEKSALGRADEQAAARWLIWECAQALGAIPTSIHDLYTARGRGETPTDFTVPAMNFRALSYDCARAAFRAALALDVGAMIFEIARSEIGYTHQRPAEYASAVLAAAIKEGWAGPVFIQGDHFQFSAKRMKANPEAEVKAVRDLTAEAIAAGFFNIDVDSSTLVDLSKPNIPEQQAENTRLCAELTAYIRSITPKGITISVGGEIGEVGGKNSTEQELRAFMDGYRADLLEQKVDGRRKRALEGISKISVQTGTSHGGVVTPDGSIADVAVDFDTLKRLSFVARKEYGLAGAVQHGASTLPESAFGQFAECGACEVHLATGFMNKLYDLVPDDLRGEIYAWLTANAAGERRPGDTDDQFFYKTRKQAIGPFKAQLWALGAETREAIGAAWEAQIRLLFDRLNVSGSRAMVEQYTQPVKIHKKMEAFGLGEVVSEEVEGLAD